MRVECPEHALDGGVGDLLVIYFTDVVTLNYIERFLVVRDNPARSDGGVGGRRREPSKRPPATAPTRTRTKAQISRFLFIESSRDT